MSKEAEIAYDNHGASAYSTLQIVGTTYEVPYHGAARLINTTNLESALDFGAGAGRSSKFLADLGFRKIYAVDRSEPMVREGQAKSIPGVNYMLIESEHIDLPDKSVCLAISFSVFIEFTQRKEMDKVCSEIYRVVKPGGQFIIVTSNPEAFGHSFKTYRYDRPKTRVSGERIKCTVNTSSGELQLLDTYWSISDYRESLESAGFEVASLFYPLGVRYDFPDTDEAKVAPSVVIEAIRPSASDQT